MVRDYLDFVGPIHYGALMALAALSKKREVFKLYLIKPSHYDEDGYVIQWIRSEIPSNTMAALNGIAEQTIAEGVLGGEVDIEITARDETNTRIVPSRIIREITRNGGRGLVALVGVQSNQFPRAVDIAQPLRAAGIPVCIGGFHVSGCLSMLPELPADIRAAMDMGISIFAGEAEGRFGPVLEDAYRGELKPLYNYMNDLPGLEGAPIPVLPRAIVEKNKNARTSFDSGRGCPFQCSFCTIINVQGRKSRYRTADDIETILQVNLDQGITSFFITDDNFARNRNWEAIFDRIIEFRERKKVKIKLIIQVDTLCHKIANFVEKAGRAGVKRVFIGLENINPDNLMAANKRQNRITEYRKMLQDWRAVGAVTYCGYILGFPADTPDRILRDIEILQRELPVDLVEFFCLTPLPGSEDHKVLDANGVWMDPDMNKYDLEHVCTGHPLMSPEAFQDIYNRAWDAFYTIDHVETLMRRAIASGIKSRKIMRMALWFYACHKLERVHPLQGGLFRRKYRKDRRSTLPVESPLVFYPRLLGEIVGKHLRFLALYWKFSQARRRVEAAPNKHSYSDLSLTPPEESEMDELDIFTATEFGQAAVKKVRKQRAPRAGKDKAAKVAAAE